MLLKFVMFEFSKDHLWNKRLNVNSVSHVHSAFRKLLSFRNVPRERTWCAYRKSPEVHRRAPWREVRGTLLSFEEDFPKTICGVTSGKTMDFEYEWETKCALEGLNGFALLFATVSCSFLCRRTRRQCIGWLLHNLHRLSLQKFTIPNAEFLYLCSA